MKITLTGCKQTPRWETLQEMLRESLDDNSALITRIARKDNGVDYRGLGEYTLDILHEGYIITLELSVLP